MTLADVKGSNEAADSSSCISLSSARAPPLDWVWGSVSNSQKDQSVGISRTRRSDLPRSSRTSLSIYPYDWRSGQSWETEGRGNCPTSSGEISKRRTKDIHVLLTSSSQKMGLRNDNPSEDGTETQTTGWWRRTSGKWKNCHVDPADRNGYSPPNPSDARGKPTCGIEKVERERKGGGGGELQPILAPL